MQTLHVVQAFPEKLWSIYPGQQLTRWLAITTTTPCSRMVERIEGTKARELTSQDKDSLIREGKRRTKQVMQGQSLATSHKQNDDQPVSEQMAAFPQNPSSQFYCWAWCYMVWNNPSVSLSQLSSLCPLPTYCTPPNSWWGLGCKAEWGKREDVDALRVLLNNSQNTGMSSKLF